MKTRLPLISILLFLVMIFSCGEKKMDEKERSGLILSSRNLGLAYLEENKLAEAEVEFNKLVKLAPKEAMGYANLGLVYLRMGKIPDAEKQINRGLEIEPSNPDIRLILATIYQISEREEKSIAQLEMILKNSPGYIKALFALVDIYSKRSEEGAAMKRENYIKEIVKSSPANLVGRLYLTESLLDHEEYDEALAELEGIKRVFPEFPGESNNFYLKAVELLQSGKGKEAIIPARIFHNFLKLTPAYQSAVQELKGPRGDLIGFPVITMGDVVSSYVSEGGSILDGIRFTDVANIASLQVEPSIKTIHTSSGDFDNDGDHDVFLCISNEKSGSQAGMLYKNDMGTYSAIQAQESGINIQGNGISSTFADYDNDGFLDLFILTDKSCGLFRNSGEGKFIDVSSKSGISSLHGGNFSLFVDMDHDGDLDLYTGGGSSNRLYRNNSDGTFLEQSRDSGIDCLNINTSDADFGDFDDDGDIDLVLANKNSGMTLFSNLREGKFENISKNVGIDPDPGTSAVAVGDYNNDGYLDIFAVAVETGHFRLLQNKKDGTFMDDKVASSWITKLSGLKGNDAEFFDFDNDGSLDLLIGGAGKNPDVKGVYLFHNDGWGKFEDKSNLIPDSIKSAKDISLSDFNEDGDLDIYLTESTGKVFLLRNDGGNANHYLKIQLVGIRSGSSKNNYYGIGSKLEVRAGELYQMKLITSPDVLIGLGNRAKADVVRIQWTNGVSQNIFSPASDQDLVEQQELKGSCPFLYAWNGEKFAFVKDIMWKSALGMPMGIMNGSKTYAFPDASVDFIKVSGEQLRMKGDHYELQMTSELWETIYADQIILLAVDHPTGMDIYVDEKFTPPPFGKLEIYPVKDKKIPVSAVNEKGNDVLPMLKEKDDVYVSGLEPAKFQGITSISELILDPGLPEMKENTYLFLQGWIFPTDASINYSLSQQKLIKPVMPYLQVIDKDGKWVTVNRNIGFPMGKDKTIIVDLTGIFKSKDHRVRIVTNLQIYWDHAFFAEKVNISVAVNPLRLDYADIHYRGFSKMYRKGGRYGPHWFEYNDVSRSPKYRDLGGMYTRYGDVLPLLLQPDDQYIISNAGDEITLRFDPLNIPALKPGYTRDFLIHSTGWVKDGDMNTARGNTVEPLPFHSMRRYPYDNNESYPSDPGHLKYLREYNTRQVNNEKFKDLLRNSSGNK